MSPRMTAAALMLLKTSRHSMRKQTHHHSSAFKLIRIHGFKFSQIWNLWEQVIDWNFAFDETIYRIHFKQLIHYLYAFDIFMKIENFAWICICEHNFSANFCINFVIHRVFVHLNYICEAFTCKLQIAHGCKSYAFSVCYELIMFLSYLRHVCMITIVHMHIYSI